MENASKALIIAGAILLSILIITLGLIVYQQAKETVTSAGNLSEQEIAVFNQKFDTYTGSNVPGTKVNNLIDAVSSSNIAAVRDNTGSFVTISFPSASVTSGKHVVMGVYLDGSTYKTGFLKNLQTKDAALTSPLKASSSKETSNNSLKVKTGKTYEVTLTKNSKTGLVETILVVEK